MEKQTFRSKNSDFLITDLMVLSNSLTNPRIKRIRKQSMEVALAGIRLPNPLPSKRKMTRIPVDSAVMTATEAAGIFTRSVP